MKIKVLIIGLILTSLVGFLEWGQNNSMFLFQAEYEVITKLVTTPASVLHPFTILPLIGQIILLFTLMQKKPNKLFTYISIALIGLLLWFILVIGLISLNIRIILSTIPYTIGAVMTIKHYRKVK